MSQKAVAYDEAKAVKATDTPVNKPGPGLNVTSVPENEGPFDGMQAVTTNDVTGTTARGDNVGPTESAESE